MDEAAKLSSGKDDEEGAVAYRRLSMRRIREILRLKCEAGLSQRAIARAIGVSNSTVSEVFSRLGLVGLTWPLPEGISDAELEERLYRRRGETAPDPKAPDWAQVHAELAGKHVTLALLWQEYRERYRDGYGYSWFCQHYRAWEKRIHVVMRQEHKAGQKLPYIDSASGEVRQPPCSWPCSGPATTPSPKPSPISARRASSPPTCTPSRSSAAPRS